MFVRLGSRISLKREHFNVEQRWVSTCHCHSGVEKAGNRRLPEGCSINRTRKVMWLADFQLQFSPLVLPFKYSFSNFQSREFRLFFFCHCLTYCVNLICGPSSCGSSPVHSLLVGNFWPGVRAFCISSMLPSSIKFMLGYYIFVFAFLLLAWVLLPMMAGEERSWIASG